MNSTRFPTILNREKIFTTYSIYRLSLATAPSCIGMQVYKGLQMFINSVWTEDRRNKPPKTVHFVERKPCYRAEIFTLRVTTPLDHGVM